MVPQGEGVAEAAAGVSEGGVSPMQQQDDKRNRRLSPLHSALVEFVLILLVTGCWNYFRKTGESLFDTFAVAALTATFLYFIHHSE